MACGGGRKTLPFHQAGTAPRAVAGDDCCGAAVDARVGGNSRLSADAAAVGDHGRSAAFAVAIGRKARSVFHGRGGVIVAGAAVGAAQTGARLGCCSEAAAVGVQIGAASALPQAVERETGAVFGRCGSIIIAGRRGCASKHQCGVRAMGQFEDKVRSNLGSVAMESLPIRISDAASSGCGPLNEVHHIRGACLQSEVGKGEGAFCVVLEAVDTHVAVRYRTHRREGGVGGADDAAFRPVTAVPVVLADGELAFRARANGQLDGSEVPVGWHGKGLAFHEAVSAGAAAMVHEDFTWTLSRCGQGQAHHPEEGGQAVKEGDQVMHGEGVAPSRKGEGITII